MVKDENRLKKLPKHKQKILKEYWKQFKILEDRWYADIKRLEKWMNVDMEMKNLEFAVHDGDYFGIADMSKYQKKGCIIAQREELEKEEL